MYNFTTNSKTFNLPNSSNLILAISCPNKEIITSQTLRVEPLKIIFVQNDQDFRNQSTKIVLKQLYTNFFRISPPL